MRNLSSIVRLVLAVSVGSVLGCENSGGKAGPEATYAITDGEQTLGAIPWPSDTLRDANGNIPLSTLPIDPSSPNIPAILADLKSEQDGFGATSGAFFPIGHYSTDATGAAVVDATVGAVDATTLDGHVHLYPLACPDGSVDTSTAELPVFIHLRAQDKPQRIYTRPEQGVVLRERCTYAYVITTDVRTDKGALSPSADTKALLADATPESRLVAAHTIFAPLRARLATTKSTHVAVATVFTVHSLTRDYVNARSLLVAAGKPTAKVLYVFARTKTAADDGTLDELFGTPAIEQPGDDNPGGLAHANIEYVVQGTYESIDFLGGATKNAMGIDATAIGAVQHDGGMPKAQGTITIPFTLVVPVNATLAAQRIAVVQHGLGGSRSDMLTVANTLAGKGVASLLIDLPFHAARAVDAKDVEHDFTMAMGADGFGEGGATASFNFFDAFGNSATGIPSANPAAIRSAFFQSVNDIEQVFRLANGGDLSAIGTREPRLATLAFDTTHETYVGESFGSMIGTIVSAFEPGLVATVLDVGGGGTIFPLLINSATFGPEFGLLLDAALGTSASATNDGADTDWGYNLAQWLLDVGDSLAYSPYVVAKQSFTGDVACHVLQISAYLDELVPNPSNLALARGMGLTPLVLSDGVAPDLTGWPEAVSATGSLQANDGGQTAVFIQFRPAVHGLMTQRHGQQRWDLSSPLPFDMLPTPVNVDDPIDRVNQIVGDFIDAASQGMAPKVQ